MGLGHQMANDAISALLSCKCDGHARTISEISKVTRILARADSTPAGCPAIDTCKIREQGLLYHSSQHRLPRQPHPSCSTQEYRERLVTDKPQWNLAASKAHLILMRPLRPSSSDAWPLIYVTTWT